MNSVLLRSPYVKEVFIQPAASDAGCALGAAIELYHEVTGKSEFEMNHAYLGPEYNDEEIISMLNEAKVEYEKRSDIISFCSHY